MVEYKIGNILESDCNYICHQVNCKGAMGTGIAGQIRHKYPKVYIEYMEKCKAATAYPSHWFLGEIQIVELGKYHNVINMFSQDTYGEIGRHTNYEAFMECLLKIKEEVPVESSIAFPYKIGCGLGGGNWEIIQAMIEQVFADRDKVYIYKLED